MSVISASEAILLENISKFYPGIKAVSDIHLKVRKGTIHGFLGPNGAGKTTTMKIISGLITPTSGKVSIDGRLGYLPDVPPLYRHMTVKEFLAFVYDIQTLDVSSASDYKIHKEKNINNVLSKTGLVAVQDRLIEHLSKGYQQRVGIAEALVHNPDVIILDEPTVGLDPVAIKEIRDLIKSLKQDHTILFSTHLLNEVEILCDDISIISEGKILVTGPIQKIKQQFQGTFQVKAQVMRFSPSDEESLKKVARLDDLKVEKNSEGFELSCYSSLDTREEISKLLVERNTGLLGLRMDETRLEDIFRLMMQKRGENS